MEIDDEEIEALKKVLGVVSGKGDAKSRVGIVLNPEIPQTSSNLSVTQVDYVRDANWLGSMYEAFVPISMDAEQLCLSNLSKGGWGVIKAIELQSAIEGLKKWLKAVDARGTGETKKK